MFRRGCIPVWIGISFLCGMFLMGQDTWPPPPPCVDADADGYGNPMSVLCSYPYWDCDDGDATVNPGAAEICDNGKDDDCNGRADDKDPNCPVAVQSLLPDTGITTCYNRTEAIDCPFPDQSFRGQDAQYETNPMSFSVNGDGTVTDNVTGLMWQREYEITTRSWSNAMAYCEDLTLADYTDWRVPNLHELQSIVDYGRYNPAIDTLAFPGVHSRGLWSSSPFWSFTNWAWYVNFYYGYIDNDAEGKYVRCVRGEASAYSYTDHGDGTVSDNRTGLMWQQQDDDQVRTWESALAYCEDLELAAQDDWRLPDMKELGSLVDTARYYPAIDPTYFPGTNVETYGYYWSSSTDARYSHYAWYVYFLDGRGLSTHKTYTYYVRCVR